MEKKNPREFDSLEKTISSLSSHPLLSTIVTFYTLVIIYFPSLFLPIVFSPVLISTAVLLLTLLRLGAIQRIENDKSKWVSLESNQEAEIGSSLPSENENSVVTTNDTDLIETELGSGSSSSSSSDPSDFCAKSFVEWDVRAPLEVIHEGEEDEQNDDVRNEKTEDAPVSSIERRYGSLSLYYPESDSDDSSDDGDFAGIREWDSPGNTWFTWEEDNGDEELIEIAFDGKGRSGMVQFEEENLIEIDISPARTPARVEDIAGRGLGSVNLD